MVPSTPSCWLVFWTCQGYGLSTTSRIRFGRLRITFSRVE